MDVKIHIGLDEPHQIAYDVCKHSILKFNSRHNLKIFPINYNLVRNYQRKKDLNESTQFSFARFWVPWEDNFKGVSIFLDSDFIFLESIDNLIDLYDDRYAIMCCKHDYIPTNKIKMDGKKQTNYPRKNWSSLIIFNNNHSSHKHLTPLTCNSCSGEYLHRFKWLKDGEIGSLPLEWNWLVDWYSETDSFKPKALHYTEGGPWLENYKNCSYNIEWNKLKDEIG